MTAITGGGEIRENRKNSWHSRMLVNVRRNVLGDQIRGDETCTAAFDNHRIVDGNRRPTWSSRHLYDGLVKKEQISGGRRNEEMIQKIVSWWNQLKAIDIYLSFLLGILGMAVITGLLTILLQDTSPHSSVITGFIGFTVGIVGGYKLLKMVKGGKNKQRSRCPTPDI